MSNVKRLVILSIFLSISVVVSYVESFIPIPIPGVKLGLANVVILLLLYEDKWYNAFWVLLLRIFIVGFIRGSFLTPTWFMSLSGGLSAFLIMFIFSHVKIFSSYGVSVLGSVFHCMGQIIVAMFMLDTLGLIYYFPVIALLSIITGALSGYICILLRRRYREFMKVGVEFE